MNESISDDSVIEISLLGTLRRRWGYLAFGIIVGVSLSALYYLATTRVYESQIEILVGERSSELTTSGTMTSSRASGDSIQEDQLATHIRLLLGRRNLANAIEKGNLQDLESFRKVTSRKGNLVDHILQNIDIQSGGDGSARNAMVLRATYRDPKAEDAAIILNAVYESYRDYVESHGENSTEQAVVLIEQARETHEKELAQAADEYRMFVLSVPVLVDGEKVQDIHKDRLANLEIEMNKVRASLAESQSRLEVIESYVLDREESIGSLDHLALLSQKEVERLKLFLDMTRSDVQSEAFQAEQPFRQEAAKAQYNRLLDLIQKEQSLGDAFGSGHPLVAAVQREIEITKKFMESNAPAVSEAVAKKIDPKEMLTTYTMLLRHDIAEAEKRMAILQDASGKELGLAKNVENDFMKGNSLKSKLTRAQTRYDEVFRRLQELNLSKSYAGFSTDLLAAPEPAIKPAWPNLPIVGAIGSLLGMILGLCLAFTAELLDSTFSDEKELERVVGAVAIAHVPRFKYPKNKSDSRVAVSPSIVAFHSPRSAEAEIYRVARTSLLVLNKKNAVRSMMMTSPQPGDGKSTTISNLAVSFALVGKRVLLIDADMRRPMIGKLFGVQSEFGLADVLTGVAESDQAIKRSQVPNLDVMSHGAVTSEPAELLESDRFQSLLREAVDSYDLVLIDAPPVLAVADPAIIGPQVDSVVLTVRVTKNGRRPVEHAIKILNDNGVSPYAVIVNAVDSATRRNYRYGSSGKSKYGYVGQYHAQYASKEKPAQPGGSPQEMTR
jgi:succinoglycan biosynthesis transport protein ExoP